MRRLTALLMTGTLLSGPMATSAALAQQAPAATAPAQAAPDPASAPTVAPDPVGTVRQVVVQGNERLEAETVRSYIGLSIGDEYDRTRLDQALKTLYATELFADATIRDDAGTLIVQVRENPVINRIVLEGNKRIKEDKIREEIRLAPRQIFTRSKARADVSRILEVYRRSGRFAANVEPKIVQLDQNRVDVVFEIQEGAKSKVRQINIIGNARFSDGDLIDEMATRPARWYRFFTSNDTYDPDRMAYDQQKLRQFYLTEGYADFRVVSAVAELTPDRQDFIITYVVEEGDRYKFGDVDLESQIRDVKPETFKALIPFKKGDWYNAKLTEDTIDGLTETAGLLGYAFADVRPQISRDKETKVMNITFQIAEAPRVYVERIDINGNVRTKDEVVRREFRLAEGDAFNSFKVKRSRDRIQSLGYFQEKFEIEQKPGSGPDKIVLEANVEEKATGELQVSAGFSSIERFLLNLSIAERNFMGKGQTLRASVNYSSFSRSIEAGFTEPYFLGKNLVLGADVFRRDYESFGFGANNDRETIYDQVTTGFQVRTGFPITEFWAAQLRYGLSREEVDLADIYFRDLDAVADTDGDGILDGNGIQADERTRQNCQAGVFICEAFGNYNVSSLGYSIVFDNLNNRLRPSAGQRFAFSQDVAGVGLGVKYVRTRSNFDKYWGLGNSGFIFSVGLEGGYIFGWGGDNIRLTDRYFLGEPRFRGFDIRGVGPRSIQREIGTDGLPIGERSDALDTALGGNAYYLGRLELEIPLGAGGRELGLRPSAFLDAGALWNTGGRRTSSCIVGSTCQPGDILDEYLGDTWKPRAAAGIGVSWNSPFGPFRIDFAKPLLKRDGDDPKTFIFNVGTQF
ncbi:outer membrane protein assembly factor BamA [Sphingoaurantiacus capsulatus]|uniref:Outer membrane protein assembly factor BamA n=1 Tax=Sphingoaurantiacus capsulatus TaxID=1771310 RepID=A0ABV7XCP7_9SPHN